MLDLTKLINSNPQTDNTRRVAVPAFNPLAGLRHRPYADTPAGTPVFSMAATFGSNWVHADSDTFDAMVHVLKQANT